MTSGDHSTADKAGARIGFVGVLLGALIGGVGSFAGAYFTTDAQRDQAAVDERRTAYVKLLNAGEAHNLALVALREAVQNRDATRYLQQRQLVREARQAQYRAVVEAYLIVHDAEREEHAAMLAPYDALAQAQPPLRMEDFDAKLVDTAHADFLKEQEELFGVAFRDMNAR